MADADEHLSDERNSVVVGRIRGAWGVQGYLKVEVLTDVPSRFSPGSVVFLGSRSAEVQRVRQDKKDLLVKLDLANDRTEAEAFHGRYITVPRSEVNALPEGSYYHFELIDIDVWTDDGVRLGRVSEIITTGTNDVYVVSAEEADKRDVLVPALADVVLDVDLEANRMTVRLPEGLG